MSEKRQTLTEYIRQLHAEGNSAGEIYKKTKDFIEVRARESGTPVHVSFELTPLCNLDCKMCYVHLQPDQMKGRRLLSTEEWKDLMQQSIDCGMLYASLTGGECLSYPGFKELYLFLREKGIQVTVLTNGALMDDEWIAFFRRYPPKEVQFSLYGADDDAYERVTGQRCFDRVMHAIDAMKEIAGITAVAVTPSRFMTDAEEIVRLVHDKGMDVRINTALFEPQEETGRGVESMDIHAFAKLLRFYAELYGKSVPPQCSIEELPKAGGTNTEFRALTCGAAKSGFALNWRGEMNPCLNFNVIGCDALTVGIRKGWQLIRDEIKDYPAPAECAGCVYDPICPGCPMLHAYGAPAGHASPLVCEMTKVLVADGVYSIGK